MAGLPGSIPGSMPAGEDETQRRLRDIERRLDELGPSVAKSVLPLVNTSVVPEVRTATASNFPVTTTLTTRASVTYTVPAGYTRMVVVYTAVLEALNSSGANAAVEVNPLLSRSDGGGSGSGRWVVNVGPAAANGANASVVVAFTDVLASVSGTVTIAAQVDTFATGFGSISQLDLSVLALWLR